MQARSFLRISRKDKNFLLVGLDVFVDGLKVGWVGNGNSLVLHVVPGVHLAEVGVIGAQRAEMLVWVDPGVVAEITVGRTNSFFRAMFGLKDTFYIDLEGSRRGGVPAPMISASLGTRDYAQYLLDVREAGGGLNEFQEEYLAKYLMAREKVSSSDGLGHEPRVASAPTEVVGSFATLGLETDATLQDVMRAYRELAQIHHPDRGGKASIFARIHTSYREVLAYIEQRDRS